MSDIDNPYKSPESPIIPEKPQNSGIMMTENMLQYLNEASPWLCFIGVMGFIGCGIMGISGIIAAISMSALSNFTGEFPFWLFSLIYLPAGLLLYFPSRYVYNFGKKIRNFKYNNAIDDLELAFKNNKSLWKFLGILNIIYIAIIPLLIIIAIIVGVATAINVL